MEHLPVLLDAVLDVLSPKPGQTYLDLTAGYGGHADAVLKRTKNPEGAVAVDRDERALSVLREDLGTLGVKVIGSDFLSVSRNLAREGREFDLVLADLGASSQHFDDATRGFSFSKNGPLDMRMDASQELSAQEIVNSYSKEKIQRILKEYGEEPKAAAIANTIVANRPVNSTTELADLVKRHYRGRSRIHPATRTFQALRIAVNDEINQLEHSLPIWLKLLAPGGKLAVISFHSLEDRLVKQFFRTHSYGYEAELRLITKKPITAGKLELVNNPRARSAKLRAAAKIKTKRKD